MKITAGGRRLAAACIAVCVLFSAALLHMAVSSERALRDLKSRHDELNLLKGEYLALKGRVESVEAKKSLTHAKGIVQAVDEVFLPLGLKQKVKSIKATGVRDVKDAVEEEAEIQIERVDMNEAVNILYRFENAPMALPVRKAVLKASFDNPAHLNITMTVALIRNK